MYIEFQLFQPNFQKCPIFQLFQLFQLFQPPWTPCIIRRSLFAFILPSFEIFESAFESSSLDAYVPFK